MSSESVAASISDSLDIEDHFALVRYLRSKVLLGTAAPLEIRTLLGGVSNRAVLVVTSERSFVVKQALSTLRVRTEWHSDPSRIHVEALGLHWLEKLAPKGSITPLLFEDLQQHVIIMQAVAEPHENWKSLLLKSDPDIDHVEQFAELLAIIHLASANHSTELASIFDDRTFFETLRIEPYYRYSTRQLPASAEFFGQLIEDTLHCRIALVHGDYSPKNILIHAGRLVLLDHEVIHFGDPAFDMGFSLTHLLSKAHHFPSRRKQFAKAAHLYVSEYLRLVQSAAWSRSSEERAVRHTLGCLMARVVGRSVLEYLGPEERNVQLEVVMDMMARPPARLSELISEFFERLLCR